MGNNYIKKDILNGVASFWIYIYSSFHIDLMLNQIDIFKLKFNQK